MQLVMHDGARHRLKVDSRGRTGNQRGMGWLGFLGGTPGPRQKKKKREYT